MDWMPHPKDKDLLNGYKNMTPIYTVYKSPTSKQGTHMDWKWRPGKRYFTQMETKKKAGVAIIISDKIDTEINAMKRDKGHNIIVKQSIQEEDTTIINK